MSYTLRARGADTVLISFSRRQTCTIPFRSRCTNLVLSGCRVHMIDPVVFTPRRGQTAEARKMKISWTQMFWRLCSGRRTWPQNACVMLCTKRSMLSAISWPPSSLSWQGYLRVIQGGTQCLLCPGQQRAHFPLTVYDRPNLEGCEGNLSLSFRPLSPHAWQCLFVYIYMTMWQCVHVSVFAYGQCVRVLASVTRHTCTYRHLIHTLLCMYVYIYIFTGIVCLWYVCIYTYVYICVCGVHICMYESVCKCVCKYISVYICAFVYGVYSVCTYKKFIIGTPFSTFSIRKNWNE